MYNKKDIIDFLYEINNLKIKEEQIKRVLYFSNIIMVSIKIPINDKSQFIISETIVINTLERFLLKKRVEKIIKIKKMLTQEELKTYVDYLKKDIEAEKLFIEEQRRKMLCDERKNKINKIITNIKKYENHN